MNNVHDIPTSKQQEFLAQIESQALRPGGRPPYDGNMEARVAKLESIAEKTSERLSSIEKDTTSIKTQLEGLSKHYATKADLVEAINGQIKWMVATAVVLGVGAITIMSFVLNNAVPKTAQTQPAQQPIIINVPAPFQTPVAAPLPQASASQAPLAKP